MCMLYVYTFIRRWNIISLSREMVYLNQQQFGVAADSLLYIGTDTKV